MKYDLLFGDAPVLVIDMPRGDVYFYNKHLLPFGLYLEEENEDYNNGYNFNYWLSSRLLSLDRVHSKVLLNTLNLKQAVSDKDRADIVLKYHSVCLQDLYWTREHGSSLSWKNINLFDNNLNDTLFDISLMGKGLTVSNQGFVSQDLNLHGMYPKAWRRINGELYMFKANGILGDESRREVYASNILDKLQIPHLHYNMCVWKTEEVSVFHCMCNKDISIVTANDLNIWCVDNDLDLISYVKELDSVGYAYMSVADYLLGNIHRHRENWGIFVDKNNKPLSLHTLFDFNNCFRTDRVEGVNCLPEFNKITQKQAALNGIEIVDINFDSRFNKDMFLSDIDYDLFMLRLNILKEHKNAFMKVF